MKLVILESPAKSKTVGKYLGKGFSVVASVGHIRDLAITGEGNLGVDVDHDFAPIYEVNENKTNVIKMLKSKVEKAEEVYLATDPDREGEAISWHLAMVLGLDVATTKRLEFHEITKWAVEDAMKNPGHINMSLVHSQETRRILDRIIGFKLSGLLQKKISARSAGRVQSAVLKLIVDREKEIKNFKEESFYTISVETIIDGNKVLCKLVDEKQEEIKFTNITMAEDVIKVLEKEPLVIYDVIAEEKNAYSKPAYTTSSLLQDAYNLYRFDSKKTMKLAQKLYEGVELGSKGPVGLITYMRTDSVRLNPAFINQTKEVIKETYGEEYVGFAKTNNQDKNNVQDAHEAIRPTDIKNSLENVEQYLSKDEFKIYKMIYIQTMCSMMKEEKYLQTKVLLSLANHHFLAMGERTTFAGYTVLYKELFEHKREAIDESITKDSKISKQKGSVKTGKTKPLSRYNESRLIAIMKKLGIARPSTYATTLDTIKTRGFVIIKNGYYEPTYIGNITTQYLDENFSNIINSEYTSKMEDELDDIAEGRTTELEALNNFYAPFMEQITEAWGKTVIETLPPVEEDLGVCPQCGKKMVRRNGSNGTFIACSGYPECKFILKNKEGLKCPDCEDGHLVAKKGRFGKFYGCSNYPNCKHTEK